MIKKQVRITWAELNLICAMRGIPTDGFREDVQRTTFFVRLSDDEASTVLAFRAGDICIVGKAEFCQNESQGLSLYNGETWDVVAEKVNPNRVARGVKDKKPLLPHKKNGGGLNVLVIGDLHAPFTKKGYLEFCQRMYIKHKCSSIVFTGDMLDFHASSYHETNPDGQGAGDELTEGQKIIMDYYAAFPIAKVCIGNHDSIPDRKAFTSGVSNKWIKSMVDVFKSDGLDISGWEFSEEFIINGVLYTHGIARKARQRSQRELISVVQGHYHSETSYETFVSENRFVFALQVGCGIDRRSYAMAYGRHFNKPQLNVGVVMDNGRWALIEHMDMG